MDHTAFIAALPAARKAALMARSDRAGLWHLTLYLAALVSLGAGIAAQVPLWPLLMLPYGVLLVFLFTLSHECTHQTPFRTPWLNDLIGHAIAPVIALPFVWFRYFHLAHHKYTNDPARDPEIAGHPRPGTWGRYLLYLSGWLYWRGMAAQIWANAFGTIDAPYLPARKHRALRREARLLLAVYAFAVLTLIWSPLLLWLWLVPVLIGQPFLRAYLLAEHGLCPPVANMFENTRTTLTGRLVRFVAWNMPFHAEHHAAPNVPFHQLPALHQDMAPHLKSISESYTAFTRDYQHSLR